MDKFFEVLNTYERGLGISRAIQDCKIEDNDVTGKYIIVKFCFTNK